MAVTSILRDTNNNVSLVRMISTDTLATVGSTNYILNNQNSINELNSGIFRWFASDMLLVAASDGNALFTFTDSTFSTLIEYTGNSSGTVNPGTINQLAYYAATGSTVSGLATADNALLNTNNTGVPSWIAKTDLFGSPPTIGNITPNQGVFSVLEFPIDEVGVTENVTVDPADLCGVFNMQMSGLVVSVLSIADYQQGFQFWIKNSSNGNITFTPHSGDNIEGSSSLTIPANECVQIAKSVNANTWEIISNYNSSSAGGYLIAANNLSDVANNLTSINNLQLAYGFDAINTVGASTVALTNPCPKVVIAVPSSGTLTIKMPVMNSVTPGSKSPNAGEIILVRNGSSDGSQVAIQLQDGTPLGISNLKQDQWTFLEVQSNSTANGTWQFQKNGTSTYLNASDETQTYLAAVESPTSGFIGMIPVYADGNGSIGSTGVAMPTTNGQLIIGNTGNPASVSTLTAGTGISITNGAGSITIASSASGDNVVNVTTATQAMLPNTKYIINYSGGLCTLTLPSTFLIGDEIEILGNSSGGWSVVENSGQNIRIGSLVTTTTTGSLSSSNRYDCVKLEGLVANSTMTVTSSQTAGFGVV